MNGSNIFRTEMAQIYMGLPSSTMSKSNKIFSSFARRKKNEERYPIFYPDNKTVIESTKYWNIVEKPDKTLHFQILDKEPEYKIIIVGHLNVKGFGKFEMIKDPTKNHYGIVKLYPESKIECWNHVAMSSKESKFFTYEEFKDSKMRS